MNRRILRLSGVAVLSLTLYSPLRADELLRFKSGYEMMVLSHREVNGMIIVTVEGGGEIGFPKDSLEMLEEGKATQRTGPTPHFNRMPPPRARPLEDYKLKGPTSENRALLAQSGNRGTRVGFSMNGEGQLRFGSGPQGELSRGKVGTDFKIRGTPPTVNQPPGQKRKGPKDMQMPNATADVGGD